MSLNKKFALLYARCSTELQNPDVQLEQLRLYAKHAGFENIKEIVDHGYSGGTANRPGLAELQNLVHLHAVNVVCVVRLDRMFRSLKHFVEMIHFLEEHQTNFVSIEDNINFKTSIGRLQFHLLAAFGEFEKSLIRERTIAGVAHARALGKTIGRPKINLDKEIKMLREHGKTYRDIEKQLGCSNSVIRRVLKQHLNGGKKQ